MLKTVNRSLIHFIFVLGSFIALTGAQDTGYLSVRVEDGMQVYLDTTFVAKNSFSYMELPIGDYKVHVYDARTHDWGDRGISKFITIKENEYVKLDFILTEQIKVLSLPIGGKVFAGEELIGNTPLTFDRSLVGTQTLKIEKNGYENQLFELAGSQNIVLVSNQSKMILNFRLPGFQKVREG